jgi:hypothetical protein
MGQVDELWEYNGSCQCMIESNRTLLFNLPFLCQVSDVVEKVQP